MEKIPYWPKSDFEKNLEKVYGEVKEVIKDEGERMINWLLFYEPKDRLDRWWHAAEVVIAYVIIFKAFGIV